MSRSRTIAGVLVWGFALGSLFIFCSGQPAQAVDDAAAVAFIVPAPVTQASVAMAEKPSPSPSDSAQAQESPPEAAPACPACGSPRRGCGGRCSACGCEACYMPQHYPYYPAMRGYYYFHPYHPMHIARQQALAISWGEDPRHPYTNELFKRVYADMAKQGILLPAKSAAKPGLDSASPDNPVRVP